MCRVDKIAAALVGLFFVGMACKFVWDLNHPEAWVNQPAGHDPHIYGPFGGVVALLYIYLMVLIFRDQQKIKKKATLARLLAQAEELLRQKRWREAEPIVKEIERLHHSK